MYVSLTVVVRVIVLRVVEATWLSVAGTGWARPVEECESTAAGACCPSVVCPFSAGGASDPCAPTACELSGPGLAWFAATGGVSPFLSVGKAAGSVMDSEAFISVSVL